MANLSHNDSPTVDDGFDQSAFVKDIANVIKNCEPPKGIAINGYWGTGKTSCLMQLKKELGDVVVPVWFEAWRYQYESTPVVALLHQIREKFSTMQNAIPKAKKIATVTFLGVLATLDETIKIASGGIFSSKLVDIPKIGEEYEKSKYQTQLLTNDISNVLEDAINQILGNVKPGSNKKLVIFIDDLDRCSPEAALKLLEGIKVYLNLKNCVVIFAIDQRQIEQALKKALDLKDESSCHQAREYLEKICQDTYHLPLPDITKKAGYLVKLLAFLDLVGSGNLTELEKTDLALQHRTNIKLVVETFDCLPANPRKIKALANRLSVMLRKSVFLEHNRQIQNHLHIKFGYAVLMAGAIIYTFHRELNEQLNKNPDFIRSIVNFAKNPEVDKAAKKLMKDIEPSYDGANLLPTNPSDSNVFRLHQLFIALDVVTSDEITPFLGV